MPQKLIIRKVYLPIVNLPLKCWHACGSIEISEKAHWESHIMAGSVKIQFQSRNLQGYVHKHQKEKHQFNFIPHGEATR